ncbi:hypothetical protein L1987_85610 [Smallanthus sonchifolius]|uniref:Uncharacterized protein n=1 Tax=Smallanthus sonchifolius TaxID=185202 RepID=A0ACB8XWC6_9ASTR|nr:hypothetical protein L1987_85610 [Smallanthus sonchifolius]
MTGHKRWRVYLGDSIAKSDMIFSTQAGHAIQSRTNVHVFLANKKRNKDTWDFMIKGSWSKRNCKICMGDLSNVIAQLGLINALMEAPENARFVKDRFMLEVFANVDYAFIAIVDATKSSTMTTGTVIELVTDSVIEAAFGGLGP